VGLCLLLSQPVPHMTADCLAGLLPVQEAHKAVPPRMSWCLCPAAHTTPRALPVADPRAGLCG
jgi:hypothetical protein